jgi:hypothetical protein
VNVHCVHARQSTNTTTGRKRDHLYDYLYWKQKDTALSVEFIEIQKEWGGGIYYIIHWEIDEIVLIEVIDLQWQWQWQFSHHNN